MLARRWSYAGLSVAIAMTMASPRARADDDGAFLVPPPPSEAPPWWELELGASALAPVERSAICPAGHDCVLNAGVGLGARVAYRTPDGVGWTVAYDLGVLDSASLYEVALVHVLRGGVRYVIDESSRVQPWIGGGVGLLLFGDASSVATGGGLVSLGGGVHVELSEVVALFGSLEAWLVSTAPFQTRDGATRGDPFGVNLLVHTTVGVMVRFGALVE